jgi:hypothetical protein
VLGAAADERAERDAVEPHGRLEHVAHPVPEALAINRLLGPLLERHELTGTDRPAGVDDAAHERVLRSIVPLVPRQEGVADVRIRHVEEGASQLGHCYRT